MFVIFSIFYVQLERFSDATPPKANVGMFITDEVSSAVIFPAKAQREFVGNNITRKHAAGIMHTAFRSLPPHLHDKEG